MVRSKRDALRSDKRSSDTGDAVNNSPTSGHGAARDRPSRSADASMASPANDEQLPAKVPLTCAQQEKWLGGKYGSDAALAFSESYEVVFEGEVDVAALGAAFDQMIARHDVLEIGRAHV